MDRLTKRTLKTSRGFTYIYYVSAASEGKPTIMLLHGWPDSARLWDDLATKHLVPAGYGVVIPDCLGHDLSDKPTDPQDFNPIGLTNDYAEILDAEGVDKVVISGHDWGSGIASKFYVFQPSRCCGMVTLNGPHQPKPTGPQDLDKLKAMLTPMLGYFPFEYVYLYADPVEGPKLLDAHPESLFTSLHRDPPEERLKVQCAPNGLKEWLLADTKGPVEAYATEELRQTFVSRMKRDGFTSSLCYYRAAAEGVMFEQEKDVPAERYVVQVPYLFIGAKRDVILPPSAIEHPKGMGLCPKLTVDVVDAGHWCMLAAPKEVGESFVGWLNANLDKLVA